MKSSEATEPLDLRSRIVVEAHRLGFDAIGFASADVDLAEDHARYTEFIEGERHGQMHYLARHSEVRRRVDTPEILAEAKTVICLAKQYGKSEEPADGLLPLIARYARGRDYHKFLRRSLKQLADFVSAMRAGVRSRALCDIEPILERAWAARAGLGFVGKNGLVITPGKGSYQLLGEVVTTLDLPPDLPMSERCGSCTRCLDACPTQAFTAPFQLDARRCISYLTIEQPNAVPHDLSAQMGEHLFGCDVCQEVCPYNRANGARSSQEDFLDPLGRWRDRTLTDLVAMNEAEWDVLTQGTSIRRAKRAGLARNAVIVASNRLKDAATGSKLREDATRAIQAALEHDEAVVRESARQVMLGISVCEIDEWR